MFSAERARRRWKRRPAKASISPSSLPIESIDPVYFAGTYYLAPDKGGTKPYSLLVKALADAKQCAVGRWTSRGKEHIVVVRPMDGGLAMHQLYFKAEVRTIKDLGIELSAVAAPELKLANQLIQHLAAKNFDPNEFVDEHRARVEAAIQRKVEGKEVLIAAAPESNAGRANVVDLMEALKASLAGGGAERRAKDKARKPPKQAPAPGSAAKKPSRRSDA